MKNRSKLLIASLFAGLSLGVLSGVKFATKNNTKSVQTEAAADMSYYYWKPVTSFDELIDYNNVIIGSVYSGKLYTFNSLSLGGNYYDGYSTSRDWNTNNYYTENSVTYLKTSSTTSFFSTDVYTSSSSFKLSINDDSGRYLGITLDKGGNWLGGTTYAFYKPNKSETNFSKRTNFTIKNNFIYFSNGSQYLSMQVSNKQFYVTTKSNDGSTFIHATMYQLMPRYTITLDNKSPTTAGTKSVVGTYKLNLPSITAPKKTGYTFGGYYTEENGKGTQYYNANGNCVKAWDKSSNVTLYANWTANSYTVQYNGNGNTGGSTEKSSHTYGTTKALTANGFIKTGYSFAGWATSATGAVTYTDKQSVKDLSNTSGATVNLYAKWTANKYKVTFDMANGSGGTELIDATYDSSMPSIALPTRAGYVFGGYYTGENGTGTQYYDSTGASARTWNIASDTTLYAKWTPNTYHVSLDSQGGTGGDTIVDTIFNEAVPSVTVPTKIGYDFQGYYSGLNGTGTKYINGNGSSTGKAWTTASDNTIYGYWTPAQYQVTFDFKGGKEGTSIITAEYNSSMPEITLPIRPGYTFLGFFDAETSGDQYYDANGNSLKTWDKLGDATLYAYWSANTYKVTFDAQGGVGGPTVIEYEYNEEMKWINTPTKQYFTFAGYYLNPTTTNDIMFLANGLPRINNYYFTGDITLYAKWEKTLTNFADEFLDLTGSYCSGDKSFIDALKNSFNMLSASDKEAFINTEIVEGLGNAYSSKIVEAKSRYYNMVTERGYDQFLEGMNVQPISKGSLVKINTLFGIAEEDIPEVSTVAILSLVGGFSIGGYFFLRKKKFN